jgi:excisionase family DNA binding protein
VRQGPYLLGARLTMEPTPKPNALDSTPAFTLTVAQIEEIVCRAVQSALARGTDPGPLLAAEELAERLKVPVSWVYEQSRQGNIPTVRVGRYIRFRLQEVIDSQKQI